MGIYDGLQAYWSFDSSGVTTKDIKKYSLQANDGTSTKATWTSDGHVGGAYVFNGTNSYIKVIDSPSIDITGSISLSAWVKYDVISDYILGKNSCYSFMVWSGNNKLEGSVFSSGAEYYQIRNVSGGKIISTDQWHYLTFIFDGRYTRTYVDATVDRVYDTGGTRTLDNNTSNISIGAANFSSHFMDGTIDEIAIWNRVLSQDEVSYLYNDGNGKSLTPINSLSKNPERNDSDVTSVVRMDRIINDITKNDSYLDSTNEIKEVAVYYEHEKSLDGTTGYRQRKRIRHFSEDNFQSVISWSSVARDGTWSQEKIKVTDYDDATAFFVKNKDFTSEDLIIV